MNDKKIVVFIIFLIIVILGLGGFIAVDKLLLEKKENITVTQVGDVKIDLNAFYQVSNTLTKFNNAFNDTNSKYFGYLYSKKEIKAKDFDPSAALYVSIYDDLAGTNTEQSISSGLVKSNFEKIFGKSLTYTADNINAGDQYNIKYDSESDSYKYNFPIVSNVYSPEYVETNISTTVEEDTITIKRKVFYVEYQSNEGGTDITKANIYTSNDKSKLIATMNLKNGVLNEKEVIGKYGSKIPEYTYIFKAKSVDEYNFYSIVREK